MSTITLPEGVQITAEVTPEMAELLTPDALALVADLQRTFGPRRASSCSAAERAGRLPPGELPDFLPETAEVRAGDWQVAPVAGRPAATAACEITGPADRRW